MQSRYPCPTVLSPQQIACAVAQAVEEAGAEAGATCMGRAYPLAVHAHVCGCCRVYQSMRTTAPLSTYWQFNAIFPFDLLSEERARVYRATHAFIRNASLCRWWSRLPKEIKLFFCKCYPLAADGLTVFYVWSAVTRERSSLSRLPIVILLPPYSYLYYPFTTSFRSIPARGCQIEFFIFSVNSLFHSFLPIVLKCTQLPNPTTIIPVG